MIESDAFEAATRSFVRVLGTRRDHFVEFEFALDDPELAVELVMPLPEFLSFCTRYHAHALRPEPEAAAAVEALGRRQDALALVIPFTRFAIDSAAEPSQPTTEVET